jgi:anti-anti-sigma regulatory factor
LYFANAENVRSRIAETAGADGVRAVVIDAETTPFVDVSAARMLVAVHDELQASGIRLVLARTVGQVRDVLSCVTEDDDLIGSYPTIASGLEAVGASANALESS